MRQVIVALLVVTAGCHTFEQQDAPPLDGMASAVVVAFDLETPHVIATDADDAGNLTLPSLVPHGDAELWALGFTCPLERLGLGPGEAMIEKDPTDGSLVRSAVSYRTRLQPGVPAAWADETPSEAVAGVLDRIAIAGNGCNASAQFGTPNPIDLGDGIYRFLTFATKTAPDRVILGSPGDSVIEVDAQGDVRFIPVTHTATIVAAHTMPDGVVYAFDSVGRLLQGSFDDGFRTIAESGRTTDFLAKMVGPDRADAPFELFIAIDDTAFLRYDGNELTTVAQLMGRPQDIWVADAVWLGPQEAMTVGVSGRRSVTYYTQGEVRRLEIDSTAELLSIENHPKLGVLVASEGGEIFRYADGAWVRWATTDRRPYVIAPIDDGLWIGALTNLFRGRSTIGFYSNTSPPCERETIDAIYREVVPFPNDRYLVVGQSAFFEGMFAEMYPLRQGFASCSGL